MNSRIIIAISIIILVLLGCVSSLYMPTASDANLYNTTLDTLKMSRKLYVKKCSSCHNLYLPSKYTKPEWSQILDKMQDHAKIDNPQKDLINKYLVTGSKKDK